MTTPMGYSCYVLHLLTMKKNVASMNLFLKRTELHAQHHGTHIIHHALMSLWDLLEHNWISKLSKNAVTSYPHGKAEWIRDDGYNYVTSCRTGAARWMRAYHLKETLILVCKSKYLCEARVYLVSLLYIQKYCYLFCSNCMQQILESVDYCHQMAIVHRDLKVSAIILLLPLPLPSPSRCVYDPWAHWADRRHSLSYVARPV